MGVMSPIIAKLSTLLETEYRKLKGVRRQIAFLRDELSSMNTALETVSESEEASPHAKEWISQLRELSYDVEDCIEIFMHHLGHDDTCHRLIDKITSQLSTLKARHDIGDRINELKKRALEINDRRRRYELNNPSATSSKTLEIDPRLPARFVDADRLLGIDDQRDKLVKWLADGIDLNLQRMVVAIVGFGGLGKTTLANQVFQKIKSQFDCTAFVSVSRRPDMNNILTDVLWQVLEKRNPISDDQKKNIERIREDLNTKTLGNHNLIRVIKEYLQNNRYFVVIDDIWSKEAWDIIQCAFPQNKNGSRMVATTRNQVVAKSCCFPHEDYVYHMKPLGSDDSKRLFLKRIFDYEGDCPPELKQVTDDILKKCDGLPLAIVNIASLLATKPNTKQEWERVRNSLCSALEQDHELEAVQRILFLSYYDLPHYLKICLLDLSLFPEDCEIDRERLIWRWTAEGFIVEQRGQCLKDTGENYFSELINRNMIQPVDVDYSGIPRACRVHDIMLDLLISLSAKENFVTILVDEKLTRPANKIRRLSLQGKCEKQSISPGTNRLSHVRSLTVFSGVKKMPPLLDLQVLRVLDLEDCPNMEDGDIRYIGCLIHLRYLSLRDCSIGKIPREIGKLHRLQTLDLGGTNITELPATVAQLRQLLHLFLPRGVELPNGIGNMESLEELSWFDVYKNSPSIVLELGNLTKLKLLNILWHPDGATSDEGSCNKSLIKSLCTLGEHNIRSLHIYIESGSVDFLADSWCGPPTRYLQTFKMYTNDYLSRLPRWISSLSELTCLDINIEQVGVGDLEVLKDLPALLSLKLYRNESPHETLTIGSSGFQRLKEFKFKFLGPLYLRNKIDGLSLMFEAGATPKLERLTFQFVARDTLSAYGVGFDFGICHLTSLRHLKVSISCRGARAWEVEAAEANIRNGAALLPYYPTPEIYRHSVDEMVKEDTIAFTHIYEHVYS